MSGRTWLVTPGLTAAEIFFDVNRNYNQSLMKQKISILLLRVQSNNLVFQARYIYTVLQNYAHIASERDVEGFRFCN